MSSVQGLTRDVYTASISPLMTVLEPLNRTCCSADTFAHKLFL